MTIKGKNVAELKSAAKANLREHYGFGKDSKNLALVAVADPAAREFLAKGLSALGLGTVLWETPEAPVKKPRKGAKKADVADVADVPVTVDPENVARAGKIDKNRLYAFDFVVWDDQHAGLDLVEAMSCGVTPVVPAKNAFSGMLTPFDPMQFSGNSFHFRETDPFLMFAACVAYLENAKFPEDRRILLKNVLQTF